MKLLALLAGSAVVVLLVAPRVGAASGRASRQASSARPRQALVASQPSAGLRQHGAMFGLMCNYYFV